MLGLVLASGICGLLLGRFLKIYVCLSTTLVLIAAAWSVGESEGLTAGILAFVFSVTAMQFCFLIGATARAHEDLAPTAPASRNKSPSQDYM